ncbi:Tat pathway signal sequence domain protein [Streptomyces sp. NPDC050625]|uniref:Tat pathway signal sequence domain protein n=1 Tax=Streptomyces sp. NPDC050625 TaxID=3154629 RepID=UPI003436218C
MHVTLEISRRNMLKAMGAGAAVVGAAAGAAGVTATPAAAANAFAHPGLLHTRTDLDRMTAKVKAGAAPCTAGFAKLTANRHAQSGWRANPQATVYRGAGSPQNYAILYNDIHAAYQNALRHHVSGGSGDSGGSAHADTAVAILNAWSAKLTSIGGSADRFLAAGLYGYQFANAAELVRDHPDFDLDGVRRVLLDVFHPLSESFLARHNDAVVTNYWPNWDLADLACVLAVGIFCDDHAKVERAVEYFKHGAGMGSVRNAIPVVYDDGLAEWVEAGRDQGHALLGVGLMGTVCEMAWNQGIDLYGYDDSRFLKGAQYVAKWSLGGDVPYTPNTRKKGALHGWSGTESASAAAGVDPAMTRPIWAMIANHYAKRRGLSASYVTRIAAKASPEGGGGDYGPNSGGYDQLGFGTLAFTRDRGVVGVGEASGGGSGGGTRAQSGGTPSAAAAGNGGGRDLAATGAGGVVGLTAAAGVTAVAGGLLLLRRRGHGGSAE